MNWLLRRCAKCGKYTLAQDKCPYCGGEVVVPHPPRFSPQDRHIVYRIKMKREAGLLKLNEKPYYVL